MVVRLECVLNKMTGTVLMWPCNNVYRNHLMPQTYMQKIKTFFLLYLSRYTCQFNTDTTKFERYSRHLHSKNIGINSILKYGTTQNVLHSINSFKF
jgi:hypothetical protein